MPKTKEYHFKVNLYALNRVGVMTRIANILRKFSLNIYEFHGKTDPKKPDVFHMYLWVSASKEDCGYIFKKLERLIDVTKLEWRRVE